MSICFLAALSIIIWWLNLFLALGVDDEVPLEVVSTSIIISPDSTSRPRKVSAPVDEVPSPPLSPSPLTTKSQSVSYINKTGTVNTPGATSPGASPSHKSRQKMTVQPSKSLSSLEESENGKSGGKKRIWPLKMFRNQRSWETMRNNKRNVLYHNH